MITAKRSTWAAIGNLIVAALCFYSAWLCGRPPSPSVFSTAVFAAMGGFFVSTAIHESRK
jgi:hypothetical protein